MRSEDDDDDSSVQGLRVSLRLCNDMASEHQILRTVTNFRSSVHDSVSTFNFKDVFFLASSAEKDSQ